MSRRETDIGTLSMAFDVNEHAVIDEMKRACSLTTDANLMRTALWSLADDLGVVMPSGVFDLRTPERVYGPSKKNRLKREARTPSNKAKTA